MNPEPVLLLAGYGCAYPPAPLAFPEAPELQLSRGAARSVAYDANNTLAHGVLA